MSNISRFDSGNVKSVWRSFSLRTTFLGAVPASPLANISSQWMARRVPNAPLSMACLARWTQPEWTIEYIWFTTPEDVHRLDDGVGGLDASAQGLVEVDVLARLGALDGDDAPSLDTGAHADDLDIGPSQGLVEIADVRDAVVVGELLVELVAQLRRVRLVGDGNEVAARMLGEHDGMVLLVGALAAYEEDAELRQGWTPHASWYRTPRLPRSIRSMLVPVACGEDETTMSAPCPSGHFRRSVTETPVGSRRVVRLAHGLPNQPSDMAASRLAVIDVRPERGEYATNLAKRGTPRLPSSIDRRTACSSSSI